MAAQDLIDLLSSQEKRIEDLQKRIDTPVTNFEL